jgi:hypothetical protein
MYIERRYIYVNVYRNLENDLAYKTYLGAFKSAVTLLQVFFCQFFFVFCFASSLEDLPGLGFKVLDCFVSVLFLFCF